MRRLHIIGGKNHGKTTLIVDLVRAMSALTMQVGTIKHTHHQHELDTPGKDSHRHRAAGASISGICSPSINAVFWPPSPDGHPLGQDGDDKYAPYGPLFDRCDIVLVEGDSHANAPKVEVWRKEMGTPPLALRDRSISAVITDDSAPAGLHVPQWRRSDIEHLVANILALH